MIAASITLNNIARRSRLWENTPTQTTCVISYNDSKHQ